VSGVAVPEPQPPAVTHRLWYAFFTELGRVEFATFLIYVGGVSQAHDRTALVAAGMALLIGLLSSAGRVVQVFVPYLTWKPVVAAVFGRSLTAHWVETIAAWMDAFTRAALASFVATMLAWSAAPDLSTWHSVILGAVTGAISAGIRAAQGLLTQSELPAANPSTGG